ncbi:MAG TPA: hypothetical protein VMR41_01775 [Patescibacteria group bacterium]|nr:hypothetical protein [Patescibacteria group bacterium]
MKKFLSKLEKCKSTWFLIGTIFVFFLLRLPSLVEPYWYGDEGIYEIIGRALLNGRLLYVGIWDNKPPLLYLTYAFFHSSQFEVKFASLIVGIASILVFFFLARKLFKQTSLQFITTAVFAFLFATPMTEGNIANAENFMLLPIIAAGLLIWTHHPEFISGSHRKDSRLHGNDKLISNHSLMLGLGGLLLGIAFLYKIVAVFDLAAFAVFIILFKLPSPLTLRMLKNIKTLKNLLTDELQALIPYLLGFILPLLITTLYFAMHGAVGDFFHSAFSSNVGYVGYGNAFIIPQGLLIFKLLLLAAALFFIFQERNILPKEASFILLWFIFAVFDSYFSQRNYTHYILMAIPSLSLLLGLPILLKNYKYKRQVLLSVLVVAVITISYFINIRYNQLPSYYANFLSYITNHKSVTDYQAYFDHNTPRDYMIADYLRMHVKSGSPVFIWGNSAQIYVLSNTFPPGKYTVAYHITASAQTEKETLNAIETVKPQYMVLLDNAPALPFSDTNYSYQISLGGTLIYERNDNPTFSR